MLLLNTHFFKVQKNTGYGEQLNESIYNKTALALKLHKTTDKMH